MVHFTLFLAVNHHYLLFVVQFIKMYPKSKVANHKINCEESHKDSEKEEGFTLIYQGLMERDVEENNQKILTAGKRKR